MIVPMLKYTFLVYHKEYEGFLKELGKLGLVHVIEKSYEETDKLREKKAFLCELDNEIKFLKKRNIPANEKTSGDGVVLLREIQSLMEEKEKNKQQQLALKKDINLLEPWGNFQPEDVKKLQEANLSVRFFTCSQRKFSDDWKSQYNIEIINEISGNIYFVIITQGAEPVEIDAEEIKLPALPLNELLQQYSEIGARNEAIEKEFDKAAESVQLLERLKKQIFDEIEYEKVLLNTGREADDRLMLLEGWIPEEKSEALSKFCDANGILFITDKPSAADNVPVMLKNNKFARLYEPILKLYSLPAYYEIDLTAFFAPFFMIFFGFCLGDAGYGITILILVTLYKIFKAKPEIKPLLTLGQYLGAATVLMGMVSGTVFGVNLLDTGYLLTEKSLEFLRGSNFPQELMDKISSIIGQHFETRDEYFKTLTGLIGSDALKHYKTELMRSSFSDYAILNKFRHLILDSQSIFNLSLAFGMIQILFGMGMRAANMIKQKGVIYSVSTISWIVLIIGLIITQGSVSLGYFEKEAMKLPTYIVLGIGLFGILFFNDPSTNIFISFGKGLYDIYGMVTGVFGDLLSYIRLFALGTSGAILGLVIDKIAVQFLGISYVGPIIFVIFLLIGHTLVMLLSILGAFVHPLRLTFVEFFKNSGFTGGGKEYKPFTN